MRQRESVWPEERGGRARVRSPTLAGASLDARWCEGDARGCELTLMVPWPTLVGVRPGLLVVAGTAPSRSRHHASASLYGRRNAVDARGCEADACGCEARRALVRG